MEADSAGECSGLVEHGCASAGGGIHPVVTSPGEAHAVPATAAVKATTDRAEHELAASLGLEGEVGGLNHTQEVGVPQLHLDGPPLAEQRTIAGRHHASSSLDGRIRRQAAAVKVNVHPT